MAVLVAASAMFGVSLSLHHVVGYFVLRPMTGPMYVLCHTVTRKCLIFIYTTVIAATVFTAKHLSNSLNDQSAETMHFVLFCECPLPSTVLWSMN